MNSFNNIEKVKYTSGIEDELVSLIEYIIFNDERTNEKYIIFKLKNNLAQKLKAVSFKITEYDEDGDPILTSRINYSRTIIGENESFVPDMKYKAAPNCKTISYELSFAEFTKIIYKDGVKRDNAITLKEYIDRNKDFKAPVKAPKVKVSKETKKIQKRLRKSKFFVKEIINKNRSRALIVLPILLTIGFAVGAGISTSMFLSDNDIFEVDDFFLRFINDKQDLEIVSYHGHAKEVTIPGRIKNRNVVSIANKAFRNDDSITKVYFESQNLNIMPDAFSDCDSLRAITGYGHLTVYNGAFSECDNLLTVMMPNSDVRTLSFAKSNNVSSFIFGTSSSYTFGRIFGVDNKDIKIRSISTSMDKYTLNPIFFDGVKSYIQFR